MVSAKPPHQAPDRQRRDCNRPRAGPALARPFAKNRRDGARQISIAVVISAIGLLGFHHPLGKVVVVVASAVAIYGGIGYRTLDE